MCCKLSPDFPFQGHSNKTYQTFCNFIRENFRRNISRQDWSCAGDVLCAEWEAIFFTIVNSRAPIKTKRIRSGKKKYLGSYQICERVCAIVILLNGNLLSLTILKTGLCSKGYVIRLMEMLNLLRHPTTVPMRFFSLMATHVKHGKWLTNSRPVRLNENSVASSHELSNAFRACFHGGGAPQVGEIIRLGGVTHLAI